MIGVTMQFRTFGRAQEEAINDAVREAMEPENIGHPFEDSESPRYQSLALGPFHVRFHVFEIASLGGERRVRVRRLYITCADAAPDEETFPSPPICEAVGLLFGFSGIPEQWTTHRTWGSALPPNTVEFAQPMHEGERGPSMMRLPPDQRADPPGA